MQQFFRSAIVGIGLAAALVAGRAAAASQDAEAQELADQAIFTDYLQLDFKAAEKKLSRAIKLCEKGSCSATVHAQVYRDLAVIYITGMKRSDDGQKLLVKALELDPRVALDADLTTPELIRVFAAAKAEMTAAPEEPQTGEEEEEEAPAAPLGLPAPAEPKPKPEAAKPKPKPAAEEPEPVGSMDDSGSADCPPDFPGCEAIPEGGPAPAAEEPEDLGILNWLSASLQQDFLMFSGESGVCGTERPAELSCYRAGDTFRNSTPQNTVGSGGEVAGGFRAATTRLLIGYDRILFPNISVGARAGYAIGGGPAEPNGPGFIPIHAELRGSYWFAPLERGKIRPYATLGGGFAQVDSSVTTEVVDRCDGSDPTLSCSAGQVPVDAQGNAVASRVTVWKKTGTTFASVGGGAMYPLSEHGGITGELKGVLLFPSSGMSVSLQAGYSHGF